MIPLKNCCVCVCCMIFCFIQQQLTSRKLFFLAKKNTSAIHIHSPAFTPSFPKSYRSPTKKMFNFYTSLNISNFTIHKLVILGVGMKYHRITNNHSLYQRHPSLTTTPQERKVDFFRSGLREPPLLRPSPSI